MTRRELLVASAGLVAATACSSKKQASTASGSSLNVVQASAQLLSGTDQRVALGIFQGQKPVASGSATLRFGRNPTALGPVVPAQLHNEGIETRPIFVARTRFSEP